MFAEDLKLTLREAALYYAKAENLASPIEAKSAVLFRETEHNFHMESYARIQKKVEWKLRLAKKHPKVHTYAEMQSSNSSDALLMNIFCHPDTASRKSLMDLLGSDLSDISFGFKARIALQNPPSRDRTEIDMRLPGALIEAKLTEAGFTDQTTDIVERYSDLQDSFHTALLPKTEKEDRYPNYQVIRNLLAARQHGTAHILMCDARRPDLVRSYHETVACLRDVELRKRCRVVFWQEIAACVAPGLRKWLRLKYAL